MFVSTTASKDVFFCPEESDFYAYCLESLVLNTCGSSQSIVEFGSGDGMPVIKALSKSNFTGRVHGYELNKLACDVAKAKIAKAGLSHQYILHNQCLFESIKPPADYLVSNPPYLPASDNKLYQPLLHGGTDGITVTKKLLDLGYKNVMVLASSYSNPVGLIEDAKSKGYLVANFTISPLPFGEYSSEPKVRNQIAEMRQNNQAFYSERLYLLAGVLFTKQRKGVVDVSRELLHLLTAL